MTDAKPVLQVAWPLMLPDEEPITKENLKKAWQEYLAPLQTAAADAFAEKDEVMPDSLRTLLAGFRHLYQSMPEDA